MCAHKKESHGLCFFDDLCYPIALVNKTPFECSPICRKNDTKQNS